MSNIDKTNEYLAQLAGGKCGYSTTGAVTGVEAKAILILEESAITSLTLEGAVNALSATGYANTYNSLSGATLPANMLITAPRESHFTGYQFSSGKQAFYEGD